METEANQPFVTTPELPDFSTGPLILVFVVLAAFGAWWWWRKRGGQLGRTHGGLQIQVLATRPLGPRSHLAVVEVAGCRSLIATTAQGVFHLRELPAGEAPSATRAASADAQEEDFARHLSPEGPPAR
ncbi:MAG: FliO/MopB family protein [Verrucomicrobiota bacterium]